MLLIQKMFSLGSPVAANTSQILIVTTHLFPAGVQIMYIFCHVFKKICFIVQLRKVNILEASAGRGKAGWSSFSLLTPCSDSRIPHPISSASRGSGGEGSWPTLTIPGQWSEPDLPSGYDRMAYRLTGPHSFSLGPGSDLHTIQSGSLMVPVHLSSTSPLSLMSLLVLLPYKCPSSREFLYENSAIGLKLTQQETKKGGVKSKALVTHYYFLAEKCK